MPSALATTNLNATQPARRPSPSYVKKIIENSSPAELKTLALALCNISDTTLDVASRILMDQRGLRGSPIVVESSSEDELEEEERSPEARSSDAVSMEPPTKKRRRTDPNNESTAPAMSRYANCVYCMKDFDVTNNKKKRCGYHTGKSSLQDCRTLTY